MRRSTWFALIAIALAAHTGEARSANLVKDGSFEKPAVPVGGLTRFGTGSKIGPWKVVGASGTVDLINSDFSFAGFTYPAKSGVQWLDLSGDTNTATGVQQTINTTAGTTYSLTVYIGSVYDPSGPVGTSSTVNVLVNGQNIASFTNNAKSGQPPVQQWRKFSTEFVASGPATTIAFINGDPQNDTDCGIDKASVIQAPPL